VWRARSGEVVSFSVRVFTVRALKDIPVALIMSKAQSFHLQISVQTRSLKMMLNKYKSG
jgi:hypothetical protein